MKKLTALLLSFILGLVMVVAPGASFAEEMTGYYLAVQINGGIYDTPDPYYVQSYEGLYFNKFFYKDAFGIDVVVDGDLVTYKLGDKTLIEYKKTDLYDYDDETQIEKYCESTDGEAFFLFEPLVDAYQDDIGYTWEIIRDAKTDSGLYKQVIIETSEGFFNKDLKLDPIGTAIKPVVLKDMKNLQSYLKKMSKKPTMTVDSLKYTDKSGTMELILNGDYQNPSSNDFNVVINGKLSTEAIALLTAALKDIVPAADVKTAVDQLKRLSNIAAVPKTDQKTYDKVMKRTYNPWYFLGDFHKYMYKFEVVEKKTFVDFYITGFYKDTYSYNE